VACVQTTRIGNASAASAPIDKRERGRLTGARDVPFIMFGTQLLVFVITPNTSSDAEKSFSRV